MTTSDEGAGGGSTGSAVQRKTRRIAGAEKQVVPTADDGEDTKERRKQRRRRVVKRKLRKAEASSSSYYYSEAGLKTIQRWAFLLLLVIAFIFFCLHNTIAQRTLQNRLQRLRRAHALSHLRKEGLEEALKGDGASYDGKQRNKYDNKKNHFSDFLGFGKSSSKKRYNDHGGVNKTVIAKLKQEFAQLNQDVLNNAHGGIRWTAGQLMKALPGQATNDVLGLQRGSKKLHVETVEKLGEDTTGAVDGGGFFRVKRRPGDMAWEKEWETMDASKKETGPKVDYRKIDYTYPDVMEAPPAGGGYPKLQSLGDIMRRFPQDDVDNPPQPFVEQLLHFNYSDPKEREMAVRFRDANLPFKVYDVPELPSEKWTDEYVSANFDAKKKRKQQRANGGGGLLKGIVDSFSGGDRTASGTTQESPNNYFAFFNAGAWYLHSMGPPPTRNNNWSYEQWSEHAKYADATQLSPDQPHFYWQAGVPPQERHQTKASWTFISKDLPSFSTPDEPTFFQWDPDAQKGIQCRFGERGVTAATHYDGGKNMVAMIKGAKRYILSPPKECSKLGIVTIRGNSIFRHSLLNFGHINYLGTEEGKGMSEEERGWMERASTSMAIDTILKEGEVLYIPSHWFHYITSLQKSAQCNVRSGIDKVGTKEFGNIDDVEACDAP
mmetsp:Transcript_50124/g.74837  ORF Transcript_50124/g.74837 Transcript_50124/m.74837 type:complete len:661 (-) Transcript_50124:100-2082(-)|eukprot:CAMPEP_0194066590 /NCGR_PEP_ID=MMETSP0009_2-20130614/86102_1 /TAXON_ID=210454 /ORGANISM="Grammatophora oceanica, Strain CCMP 410" /LENGTH=660 /DNA_ID=CAMNT_0038719559 /DNA_START=108 /DNA_END=2090 /DNA_ORIENTATION=-